MLGARLYTRADFERAVELVAAGHGARSTR